MTSEKPIIALDFVGTACDFLSIGIPFAAQHFGRRITYGDCHTLNLEKLFNCSREQLVECGQEFAKQHPVHILPPVPGFQEAVRILSKKFSFAFITSLEAFRLSEIEQWVAQYCPNTPVYIGEKYHEDNGWGDPSKSKPYIARNIGASYMIDDDKLTVKHWPNDFPVQPFCLAQPWNVGAIDRYTWDQLTHFLNN